MQVSVLGADGRIIESGGDGMRRGYLPALILQHVAHGSLKDAGAATALLIETRGVLAQSISLPAGLHAYHANRFVIKEGIKHAYGIRAAADAGHERGGQAAFSFQNLLARLYAYHALKISDHQR